MKIGLLTLPLWHNYGGILQAYALKETLKGLGHSPVLVDYHHKTPSASAAAFNTVKRGIRITLRPDTPYYPNLKELSYISKHTLSFINKQFESKTPRVADRNDLAATVADFGALIAGSDQIWRPNYAPNIFRYFLDFAKPEQLKLAYAASFGTDRFLFSSRQTQICKRLLQKFDAVSVREDSGVKLCREHFDREAEQLVDPVLLLDKSHYLKLLPESKEQGPTGKLFSYVLDESPKKERLIQNTATQKKLAVFKTMPQPFDRDFKKNKPAYRFLPVEGWLKSFAKADFVITDSFHGCVFSLIFNKPFIALGNKERGLARFTSLLRLFNMEDRLFTDKNNVDRPGLDNPVNWERVNQIIKNQQERGVAFLKKNLRNAG